LHAQGPAASHPLPTTKAGMGQRMHRRKPVAVEPEMPPVTPKIRQTCAPRPAAAPLMAANRTHRLVDFRLPTIASTMPHASSNINNSALARRGAAAFCTACNRQVIVCGAKMSIKCAMPSPKPCEVWITRAGMTSAEGPSMQPRSSRTNSSRAWFKKASMDETSHPRSKSWTMTVVSHEHSFITLARGSDKRALALRW